MDELLFGHIVFAGNGMDQVDAFDRFVFISFATEYCLGITTLNTGILRFKMKQQIVIDIELK